MTSSIIKIYATKISTWYRLRVPCLEGKSWFPRELTGRSFTWIEVWSGSQSVQLEGLLDELVVGQDDGRGAAEVEAKHWAILLNLEGFTLFIKNRSIV